MLKGRPWVGDPVEGDMDRSRERTARYDRKHTKELVLIELVRLLARQVARETLEAHARETTDEQTDH